MKQLTFIVLALLLTTRPAAFALETEAVWEMAGGVTKCFEVDKETLGQKMRKAGTQCVKPPTKFVLQKYEGVNHCREVDVDTEGAKFTGAAEPAQCGMDPNTVNGVKKNVTEGAPQVVNEGKPVKREPKNGDQVSPPIVDPKKVESAD